MQVNAMWTVREHATNTVMARVIQLAKSATGSQVSIAGVSIYTIVFNLY